MIYGFWNKSGNIFRSDDVFMHVARVKVEVKIIVHVVDAGMVF